jgi:predicted peptidase
MLFWVIVSMFSVSSAGTLKVNNDSAEFITWSYNDTAMGLYLPVTTNKKLPVVMFFHGCHNNPVSSDLWIIKTLNNIEPCAVFIPTAPPELNTEYPCADWGGTYDGPRRPNMIKALAVLDSLVKVYNFDTSRIYLYGESMGGEGVYRLLQDFPGRYAGAVVSSGYTINKSSDKMAMTPLWIFHSVADEICGVDNARVIFNAIKNAGGTQVHYTEYESLAHSPAIQKTRTEDTLFQWLLKQVKTDSSTVVPKKDTTFTTWNYKGADMGFYMPESTKKLPVVMYLHYCTGTPVYPEFWIVPALNKIEPCAVFLPTAPPEVNTQYSCADWGGTYDQSMRPNLINALHELDSLIALHGLDQSRVYIYGESMGGEGVYRLLMDYPERFAGGVVAAGYTVDKGADKMAKTPLWIFHGSDDNTAAVSNARTIYQSIRDSGGTLVKYTEYEGYDHTPAMNKVHDEPGVLEWLLSQKRTTAVRKTIQCNPVSGNVELLFCKSGSLKLSRSVPSGAVLSLFGLNGEMIYQTGLSDSIVKIPSSINSPVMLWRISHPSFVASGRVVSNR